MIRINLLSGERKTAKTKIAFQAGQKITAACTLILVGAGLFIGWRYWSLNRESARLDQEIASAQGETARLQSIISQVQEFEQRRAQLQERVALIAQLRSGQRIPVQLLDQVSRSLPDMLWLTSMEQETEQVTIEGRTTTLIALSDFVGNLADAELLQRPIEIVNSQVEPAAGTGAQATPELIQFTVRAQINMPPGAAELAGGGAQDAGGGAPR